VAAIHKPSLLLHHSLLIHITHPLRITSTALRRNIIVVTNLQVMDTSSTRLAMSQTGTIRCNNAILSRLDGSTPITIMGQISGTDRAVWKGRGGVMYNWIYQRTVSISRIPRGFYTCTIDDMYTGQTKCHREAPSLSCSKAARTFILVTPAWLYC
jgi:hypothetical protein